jgi:hypothetical protein
MGNPERQSLFESTGFYDTKGADVQGWPFPFNRGVSLDAHLARRVKEQEEDSRRFAAGLASCVSPKHGCPTSRISEDKQNLIDEQNP